MLAEPTPFPAGTGLDPAADLRTKRGGRILIGGAPFTIMRLSPSGAEVCRAWFGGDPIGPSSAHQALARRLVDRGLANPTSVEAPISGSEGPERTADLTVVIPVRDDQDGLRRTLHSLLGATSAEPGRGARPMVIVVDDGSTVPVAVSEAGTGDHLQLIRNEHATGPGSARQRGLAEVVTPLVAFVDAAVVVTAADLAELYDKFADRAVVAAAPRVASESASHLVARYDLRRSPLDLGPRPSLVGPGRAVPYVPTTCLVARTHAVKQAGGFDPTLRYGEDVDLVWRLGEVGDVRYCPEIVVTHPPRTSVAAMARQRRCYGSAAAPLAVRHGAAVAPTRLSPWSALVAALAAAGLKVPALALSTWTASALRPKIEPMPDATVEATMLTCRGHWYGGLSLLTALARAWAPLAAMALALPFGRRRVAGLVGLAFARRLLDGPKEPTAAAVDIGLGIVDDLSYCVGVWQGAVAARSATSLLPDFVSWPGPKDTK